MRIPASIAAREPLWRTLVTGLGIAGLIACVARAIIKADDGDFQLHWETGRRFLTGEFLYGGGHDFPYPPFFGLVFAPAALLPMPIAKAVCALIAVAALLLLLWIMSHLVRSTFKLNETQTFWAGAIAVVLAIQFIIRDQAEVGLNTAIAALIWLGIYLWRQGRDLSAGLSLGLAIAIKCTPAIFVGYFIWKRQWRTALCTGAAALFFTAAPMAWQGPISWIEHMRVWANGAIHGLRGNGTFFETNQDLLINNMSLRAVLMRYLTDLPQNADPTSAPRSLHIFDFSRETATWIAASVMTALVAIFLWWCRRSIYSREDSRLLWEFAATGVLMSLLSPITWTQHRVGLLPTCYLVAALVITRDHLPRWVVAIVSLYTLFCSLLGRDLIGRELSSLITTYHVTTLCIVGLFAVLLAGPRLMRTQ
jgi:hypothetical protein